MGRRPMPPRMMGRRRGMWKWLGAPPERRPRRRVVRVAELPTSVSARPVPSLGGFVIIVGCFLFAMCVGSISNAPRDPRQTRFESYEGNVHPPVEALPQRQPQESGTPVLPEKPAAGEVHAEEKAVGATVAPERPKHPAGLEEVQPSPSTEDDRAARAKDEAAIRDYNDERFLNEVWTRP